MAKVTVTIEEEPLDDVIEFFSFMTMTLVKVALRSQHGAAAVLAAMAWAVGQQTVTLQQKITEGTTA